LISEYYAQRTLLFSAYSVNLICLNKPESIQDPDLLAKSRSLHNKGVKWALAGISATDPYAQFDLWQNFCDSNEFMMVSSAEGIKNAFRKQKFAFLPVITDFDQLDENGSELRNLFNLGVKSVWLNKELKVDDRSRYLLEEISKLGMVCFIEPEASILDSIPENTRLVKFIPEDETIPIPSAEDLINIRLLVNCPNPALSPDSADVLSHAVILNIPWDNEDQPLNSLKIVAELQQAGFTNEQIRYMLGENLLNILP
jgi:hypothetical protein